MPQDIVHFCRLDVIRGSVPWAAAHFAKANATYSEVRPDGTVRLYHATEHCAGVAHPDDPCHPFRRVEVDGQWVDVPRKARVKFGEMDEALRVLEADGVSRAAALEFVCGRDDFQGVFATSEDPV
jgi:hypothetical protein